MVYRNRPVVPATDWAPLPLGTGWSGRPELPPAYRIVGGVVYFEGIVSRDSGSNGTVAPLTGIRPGGLDRQDLVRVESSALAVAIGSSGLVISSSYVNGQSVYLSSIHPYPLG